MTDAEISFVDGYRHISSGLRDGSLRLPLAREDFPTPVAWVRMNYWDDNFEGWGQKAMSLEYAGYYACFVKGLKNPPQPAPVPGLRPKALPAPF